MDNKELIERLKGNQGALQALLHSRDGQALMQQLTQADGGASLQKAAMAAAKGNTTDMVRMINQVMKSQEGAELIRRINESIPK